MSDSDTNSSFECLSEPLSDFELTSSPEPDEPTGRDSDHSSLSLLSDSSYEIVQGVEDLHLDAEASDCSPCVLSVYDEDVSNAKSPNDNVINHDKELIRRLIEDVHTLHNGIKKRALETERSLKRSNDSGFLNDEIKRLKRNVYITEPSTIKQEIQGGWRLTSSKKLNLFIAKMRKSGCDLLEETLFEYGEPHFKFDGDVLTMYLMYNGHQYYLSTSILGQPTEAFGYTRVSYLEDNKLHTIDKKSSSGALINHEERFIDEGKLHIIVHCFGMFCTRVYEKIV